MTEEQEQLIAKASNSIKAAQILFNEKMALPDLIGNLHYYNSLKAL
jgi:hypothetical protein